MLSPPVYVVKCLVFPIFSRAKQNHALNLRASPRRAASCSSSSSSWSWASVYSLLGASCWSWIHWIGLLGKILTGNPWVFTIKLIKYRAFRWKNVPIIQFYDGSIWQYTGIYGSYMVITLQKMWKTLMVSMGKSSMNRAFIASIGAMTMIIGEYRW